MDIARLVCLIFLSPIPYFSIGACGLSLLRSAPERSSLTPLLGCVVLGWFSIVVFILGLSPLKSSLVLVALSLVYCVAQRDRVRPYLENVKLFLVFYCVAVLALCASPYPGLGNWSGDWLENVQMGQALQSGKYSLEVLLRTPFFAGMASPLLFIVDGLPAYQLGSAITAASALLSLSYLSQRTGNAPLSLKWYWVILLSPFYLLHTVTLWPKFLAAGAVLMALADIYSFRKTKRTTDFVWACFWFGMAMAAHHSALVFLLFFLLLGFYKTENWREKLILRGATLGGFSLMTVGLFEIWALATFGLDERVNHNPTIYNRILPGIEGIFQMAWMVLINTFTGTPLTGIGNYLAYKSVGTSFVGYIGKAYFSLSAYVSWVAGTLLSMFFLILFVHRKNLIPTYRAWSKAPLFFPLLLVTGATIVVHAFLNVHSSPWGALQTGLVPLCFLVFWVLGTNTEFDRSLDGKLAVLTFVFGTLPFLAQHLSALIAFYLPKNQSTMIVELLRKNDSDAVLYTKAGLIPLGQWHFPLPLILAALFLFVVSRKSRTRKTGSSRQSLLDFAT